MAEGDSEAGEGMLAATAVHQGIVPKREEDRLEGSNQESEDDCSSLDSCGDGNMGVPESRGHSPPAPLHDSKQHLNGLLNLSSLASLGGLQGAPTGPGPSTPGIINNQLINTPLNLSLNATNNLSSGNLMSSAQQVVSPPAPAAMPQLILASGQIIQGIQGAQLLIPTSQGIATQTILTIPINSVTNNQMVNMPMNNGQVMTTTLANLAHHFAHPSGTSPSPGSLGPTIPNPLPHLMNGHSHQNQQHLLNPFHQQQSAQQHSQQHHQNQLMNHQSQLNTTPSQKSPLGLSSYSAVQNCSKSPPINGGPSVPGSTILPPPVTTNGSLPMPLNAAVSTPQQSTSPLNTISRLAASNSDLTITTSGGGGSNSSGSTASNNNGPSSVIKSEGGGIVGLGGVGVGGGVGKYSRSPPSSMDLIDESNQPMISESRSNTVDGINLDEIKEFAKAFKLRRLSLGLTQTQVGQALSITEGPAYSQSAICSALATQMYCAAQLASQQQSMFEKLDITPKSAQKIKPVLEQWMKEAEESRYKSGQNHLTEFIGVEPSKKRKRRTSFTPQALELLNAHFERNTHPSGTEITTLAHQLGYEREVIRIWFCNKRQALKNTVRMMSKGCT